MLNWKRWMLTGALALAFGIVVLANAYVASLALATIAGVLILIAGVVQVVVTLGEPGGGERWLSLLVGALAVLLGVVFLTDPLAGTVSLAVLVVILFALSGVGRLIWAWLLRETPVFWPMLLDGAVAIFLAGFIVAQFDTVGPRLIGILFGIELTVSGVVLILLALFIRRAQREEF